MKAQRRLRTGSILLILLLGILLTASAVTATAPAAIYVAPTGNDVTGDGTAANPYETFAKAVAEVDSGGIIRALAGAYSENIVLNKSVSLVGEGAAKTKVECCSGFCIEITKAASNVTIEGFTISGGGSAIAAVDEGEKLTVVIKDNVIEENEEGGIQLAAQKGINATITGNKINENDCEDDDYGGAIRMWLDEGGELIKAVIKNNEIAGNDGGAIRLGWWNCEYTESGGDIEAVISGNEIWNNEGGAIRAKAVGAVEIEITDNDFRNIEERDAGGIIRLGFGSCYDETISEKLSALIADNTIDCGTADDGVYCGGIIRALAKTTDISILNNKIKAGYYVGGVVRIGFADEYVLVADDVTAEVSGNEIDLLARDLGGAIRLYAVETIEAKVSDNSIRGTDEDGGLLEGGAIRIGRSCSSQNHTKKVTAEITGNVIDPFRGGGVRVVAAEEIEAIISGNVITGCRGGAIRVGWNCYCDDWGWGGNTTGVLMLNGNGGTPVAVATPVVYAEVKDNVLIGNYAVGIHVEGAEKVGGSIAGNIVLDTQACDREDDLRYNHPGIYVGNSGVTAVDLTVTGNIIAGNITGLLNETAAQLDATGNWWGDESGPTHADNPEGKGDSVDGNVIYDPWFDKEEETLEVDGLIPGTPVEVTLEGISFYFTPTHGGRVVFSVKEYTGTVPGAPAGADPAGIYYEIEALGLMGAPVRIVVPYDPEKLPEGMEEKELRLYRYHEGIWELLSDQEVDTTKHLVSGTTPGFSIFGLFVASEEPSERPELPQTNGYLPLALAGGLSVLLGTMLSRRKR